jgi:hypothetical protein
VLLLMEWSCAAVVPTGLPGTHWVGGGGVGYGYVTASGTHVWVAEEERICPH